MSATRRRAPIPCLGPLTGLLFSLSLCLGGCAPDLVVPTPGKSTEDPFPLAAHLAAYNESVSQAALGGKLHIKDNGGVVFGARAQRGNGVRLDAATGAMGKLVLQLSCNGKRGCDLYLPDRRIVYRTGRPAAKAWVTELVMGRVVLYGVPHSAWTDDDGNGVVRYAREDGATVTVVMDASGRLPRRAYYADGEDELLAQVGYDQFARIDGAWFPGRVALYGRGNEPQMALVFQRFELAPEIVPETFSPPVPPGTTLEADAEAALARIAPILHVLPQ